MEEPIAQPLSSNSFISDADKLQLEDDRQKVILEGNIDVKTFVTG